MSDATRRFRTCRPRAAALVLAGLGGMTTCHAQQPPADEAALWALWSRHLAAPGLHDEHAAALAAFAKARPRDPLTPVAQILEAWHLLKLNRRDEARARLAPHLSLRETGHIPRAATELARAWTTILDREVVAEALERYRVRKVRYPESLDALQSFNRLPDTLKPLPRDRWDNPWNYRLARFSHIPSVSGMRYTLESRTLGPLSALDPALAVPYAANIQFAPARFMGGADRQAVVQLTRTGGAGTGQAASVTLGLGVWSPAENIAVVYASPRLIILRDRLHWRITPAP